MKTFEARYASRCPDCPAGIEPGDEVVYAGDVVAHAACSEAAVERVAREEIPPGSVCTECWQTKSVTGACGCDAW